MPVGLHAGMKSVHAVAALREMFREAALDDASLDARILVAAALVTDPAGLLAHPDRLLESYETAELARYAERRLRHEPVARILGRAGFWGLTFRVSAATLVPRPDTETLVELALAAIGNPERQPRILDLGTGSGCILIALLSEWPGAWGLGIDRSEEALATAWGNALRNGVADRIQFAASDWGAAIGGRFDLVVSNPPYIPSDIVPGLAPEVAVHDPLAALDGGVDGLAAYRALFYDIPRLMAPGASALVEIGYDQAEAVSALAGRRGLLVDRIAADLGGHSRVLLLKRRNEDL